MAKKDLAKMSTEALESELQDLGAEKDAIRERQREVTAELDKRAAATEAQRIAQNLSEPEKAALAQVLKAEGIKPASAVGTPSGGN